MFLIFFLECQLNGTWPLLLALHRSRLSKMSAEVLEFGAEKGRAGWRSRGVGVHGTHSGSLHPRSSPFLPFVSPFNLQQQIFPRRGPKKSAPCRLARRLILWRGGRNPIFIAGGGRDVFTRLKRDHTRCFDRKSCP